MRRRSKGEDNNCRHGSGGEKAKLREEKERIKEEVRKCQKLE